MTIANGNKNQAITTVNQMHRLDAKRGKKLVGLLDLAFFSFSE